MAIAETARLMTELGLKDGLSPGLAKARSELNAANAASAKTGTGILNLGKATSGASAAFGTFRGRLGQLAGATGLIGLGAGLFSVVGLMEKSIHQAEDFGAEVYKLQAITGLSAEKTSELAAAFHHFGIESNTALRLAGFAEKNIFAQGQTVKKTAAFYKTYGFELRDAGGHLKDFNTLLLDEADYFNNKAIPAATKDAELAKIFGRNWQALIPILKGGRAALQDAEVEAQKLGLTLTGSNLKALAKLRADTRSWGTALGGLELQIGLALVPMLDKFTRAATAFVAKNRPQIVGFFKSLGDFAQNTADVIAHQVIPTISGIYGAWMKIPADLRNFVIRGLIADRTIKFLFGFSPIKFAAESLTTIVGKIAGQFAANKLVPQVIAGTMAGAVPVWVTNPGFGKLPGGGGPSLVPEVLGAGTFSAAGLAALVAGIAAPIIMFDLIPKLFPGGAAPTGSVQNPNTTSFVDRTGRTNVTGAYTNYLAAAIPGLTNAVDKNTAAVQANTTTVTPVGAGLANLAHGYGMVAGRSGAAGLVRTPPLIRIDSEEFLRKLRTTAFIGAADYKSLFERFTTFRGGGRGTDPTGQGFLRLVEELKNPKAPAVMFEIRGHLKELQGLEAYYIAHGDIKNALKVQGVINEVDKLIGVTRQNTAATSAADQRTGATLRSLHQVSSAGFRELNAETRGVQGTLGAIARKPSSVSVHSTVNVASYNSFNVNSLASSLTSTYTRVNVGNQYQGKAVPL